MPAMIPVDAYVLDVLMRDLSGHDRRPSAFLVYLHLWTQTYGVRADRARASLQQIADATGLSKSSVQHGMRVLLRRRLIRVHKASRTAVPEYFVRRPWVRKASSA